LIHSENKSNNKDSDKNIERFLLQFFEVCIHKFLFLKYIKIYGDVLFFYKSHPTFFHL